MSSSTLPRAATCTVRVGRSCATKRVRWSCSRAAQKAASSRGVGAAAGGEGVSLGGGASVAQQYLAAGLLDEIVVSIAPVTLGAGRPLFPRPFDLRLTELAQNGAFACARYEVVGPRTT